MADAYGEITFAKSDDCVYDVQKMMDVLNTFEWDSSGDRWECYGDTLLGRDGSMFARAQYPMAIPMKVIFYRVCTEDGEEVQKMPSEMTQDDWDDLIDEEKEPLSLSDLSKAISPLIKNGWIEIACVANEKARYVYFESVRVCADGKVSHRYLRSGPVTESSDYSEEYPPIFSSHQSNEGENYANV
jgi:hypothetical protein